MLPTAASPPRHSFRGFLPLVIGALLLLGCSKKDASKAEGTAEKPADPAAATETPRKTTTPAKPAALEMPARPPVELSPEAEKACAGAEAKGGPLAWFKDDYAAALACARASDRPIFLDLWAPWCHTCISMKTTVMLDPSLAPLAERFVWLAVNTDKDESEKVVDRFPPKVWPTFYVIAPADESVQARFLGAASIGQLRALLVQGEKGFLDAKGDALGPDSPLFHVRAGDRSSVKGDLPAAAAAYRKALAMTPPDWPRRPDVLVSLARILDEQKDSEGCIELSKAELANTGRSASATDFVYRLGTCTRGRKGGPPLALLLSATARLKKLIDDESAPLSVDDRSDAMLNLRRALLIARNEEGATALAERQRAMLDEAAEKAPSPWAAMTYNWPRVEVYAFLGKGAELVPDMEQSIRDLPLEYDPPYRLAWLYLKMGEPDKALPHAEKAFSMVTGARKGWVHSLVADIHEARGDKQTARQIREDVIAFYEGLSPGQARPAWLASARAALAAMDQPDAK